MTELPILADLALRRYPGTDQLIESVARRWSIPRATAEEWIAQAVYEIEIAADLAAEGV